MDELITTPNPDTASAIVEPVRESRKATWVVYLELLGAGHSKGVAIEQSGITGSELGVMRRSDVDGLEDMAIIAGNTPRSTDLHRIIVAAHTLPEERRRHAIAMGGTEARPATDTDSLRAHKLGVEKQGLIQRAQQGGATFNVQQLLVQISDGRRPQLAPQPADVIHYVNDEHAPTE